MSETPPAVPAVEPPHEDPPPPAELPEDEIPEWGRRLEENIANLTETVNGLATKPEEVVEETPPNPGHGDVITDESPAKKPWHKRGLFA